MKIVVNKKEKGPIIILWKYREGDVII